MFLNLSPTLFDAVSADTFVFHTVLNSDAVVYTPVPTVLPTATPVSTYEADGTDIVPTPSPKLYVVPCLTSDAAGRPFDTLLTFISVLYPVVSSEHEKKLLSFSLSLAGPMMGSLPFVAKVAASYITGVAPVLLTAGFVVDATTVPTTT